jgi:hypothetical protein
MDQDEMSNLYRAPSIDTSYKVTVHLAKLFQRRFLEIYQSEKNPLGRPYLLMDRDEMSNLYRELPIDASYQVSVHLAERFQWRFFLEIIQSERVIVCSGHVCYQIGTK